MISYQTIFWRDIPAQVKLKEGRKRIGRPLSSRFTVAIDEAAMRAGLTNSEDYLGQWRNGEWRVRDGQLEEIADMLIAELEDSYPSDRLRTLIRQYGLEEDKE